MLSFLPIIIFSINRYSKYKYGLLGWPSGKESACNAGDLGSIPGLGRSPREGKDYPLHYSGLEYSGHTESGLYGPWDHKESDTTERLSHSLTEGKERSFSFTEEVGIQKTKEWWSTVSRAAEKLGRMAHKKPLDLIMSLLKLFRGADSVN